MQRPHGPGRRPALRAAILVSAALKASPSAAALVRGREASLLRGGRGIGDCGPLASYPHAKPKNFEDARPTRYDTELKKTVDAVFTAGDVIPFVCEPGYTVDGSKAGPAEFEVSCSEMGYYKPGGVCLEASKCGAVPEIPHARPSSKSMKGAVEMTCAEGYSLDGEKVVPGGMQANQLFTLKCVEFSGEYEEFTGECKPSGHVTATESVRVYNKVFEALFVVSCKGTLRKEFGAGNGPGVNDVCPKIKDGGLQGDCQKLVSEIEADFETQRAARKAHDAEHGDKDFPPAEDPDRPGIADDALEFCSGLWKLLELQPPGSF